MNIEELKRLAEAATPGPWATGFFGTHCVMGIGSDMQKKDAAFIAAANPAIILELIQQRDELLAKLDRAQAEIRAHPKMKLGESVAKFTLERLQELDSHPRVLPATPQAFDDLAYQILALALNNGTREAFPGKLKKLLEEIKSGDS